MYSLNCSSGFSSMSPYQLSLLINNHVCTSMTTTKINNFLETKGLNDNEDDK
jgi:hypothetical protein